LSSYVCNPLDQTAWRAASISEKSQLLLASLGLDFGEAESGAAYFGSLAERVLKIALKLAPRARSLRELHETILAPDFREQAGLSRHDFDNCGALLAQLERIAEMRPINWLPGEAGGSRTAAGALRFEELLTVPQVVYFRLPATVQPSSARTIPRLLIRLLVAAARRQGGAARQVYLVIDEAQETLQRSLSPVLKQARDLKMSVWLGFQNLTDLEVAGEGLSDVVLGNTSLRVFFSATDAAGRKYLSDASGEDKRIVQGEAETITDGANGVSVGTTQSSQELITPRLRGEEVNWVNAHEGICVVEASPQCGFTLLNHPVLVRTPYFCSKHEYDDYSKIAWPAGKDFSVTNPGESDGNSDPGADGAAGALAVSLPPNPQDGRGAALPLTASGESGTHRQRPEKKISRREEREALAQQLLQLAGGVEPATDDTLVAQPASDAAS
jgi:hypothetical protein